MTAAPAENGTLVARVVSVAGYADAASAGVPIAVTTKVAVTGPAYVGTGLQFALTATVTAPRAAALTLEGYSGGNWTALASATSTSTGSARFTADRRQRRAAPVPGPGQPVTAGVRTG